MQTNQPVNLYAMYGRFQPFTRAHEAMFHRLVYAETRDALIGCPVIVGCSETYDPQKNPLSITQRRQIIEACLGVSSAYSIHFAKDPWTFLAQLSKQYSNAKLVLFCGDDQYDTYGRLHEYNGVEKGDESKRFNFERGIEIVNCGNRQGSTDLENISGSKVREAALENDDVAFSQMMSRNLGISDLQTIAALIRQGMK